MDPSWVICHWRIWTCLNSAGQGSRANMGKHASIWRHVKCFMHNVFSSVILLSWETWDRATWLCRPSCGDRRHVHIWMWHWDTYWYNIGTILGCSPTQKSGPLAMPRWETLEFEAPVLVGKSWSWQEVLAKSWLDPVSLWPLRMREDSIYMTQCHLTAFNII